MMWGKCIKVCILLLLLSLYWFFEATQSDKSLKAVYMVLMYTCKCIQEVLNKVLSNIKLIISNQSGSNQVIVSPLYILQVTTRVSDLKTTKNICPPPKKKQKTQILWEVATRLS